MADEARPAGGAVRPWRHRRHHGTVHRAHASECARSDGAGRKQTRRKRQPRYRICREERAGRPHVAHWLGGPSNLSQFIFKVGYDGLKDFAPITLLNTNPLVLMVHPSLPVQNVKELIALAKAQPGRLSFAGAGGLTQFGGEIFKFMAGADMGPRALPWRRAGGGRDRIWRDAAHIRQLLRRRGLHEVRPAARACDHQRAPFSAVPGTPDDRGSGAAGLRGRGLDRPPGASRYLTRSQREARGHSSAGG
ncbi:MAG: hypothetical protein GEV05_12985 [Betaproteobacteria bacterium]|nr:hypothetical protein [Betaproteobacteria bacterium]